MRYNRKVLKVNAFRLVADDQLDDLCDNLQVSVSESKYRLATTDLTIEVVYLVQSEEIGACSQVFEECEVAFHLVNCDNMLNSTKELIFNEKRFGRYG